ncbi:Ribosomal protein S12 methylthiotransferase accessory factor YcaO [Planctomycetes bacterium Poly30]|uniref:Ribosomal protein S12 methylthiotransferase accessory factor YcaO n=1 Tax=Saltatorellus ferox TaxID=2528018 RepID=A0A518F065_9BACT|nr:Ribosomal protein S12 methylthiotransferase accessory factor YcaO [Planctomycetes bacterium Poly30]
MQIRVRFLDNLRLEASFDDFRVITDQAIRYKGDGTAPNPFQYFLASSALCAGYFVKVYCNANGIPTEDIHLVQDNVVEPDNRYQQTFRIRADLPEGLSDEHRDGIVQAMDRCTVKRVIQNGLGFEIRAGGDAESEPGTAAVDESSSLTRTMIPGKDCSLEETIATMGALIEGLGIKIEIASWRNIVPHVWSVHIRDAESPICYTNGKGATKDAALCSALGEYLERMSNNYFYNDFYLGETRANAAFVHYPDEKWFQPGPDDSIPEGLMDERFMEAFDEEGELRASHLVDANSGAVERGICALPFLRQSDQQTVYVPANLVGNIFVSNGMSAGNTRYEARVQCLSEIFERAVKKEIILEELTLPDVPEAVLGRFPTIVEGIAKLEEEGFPVLVKDASLGGRFPVMCVAIMNPRTGGVFASFGGHPRFEVALERSLTELMQGRSFEGMNDVPLPTFDEFTIQEPNNMVEHFINSTGVVSWKFFSQAADHEFVDWDFAGSTEEEYGYLMGILQDLDKEVYIADYEDLGASACRILVPGYSEIYPAEDLVWDNTNRGLAFREDTLNLHSLSDDELLSLLERLEESELGGHTSIAILIGVAFDENSPWGRCTICELSVLICLALGKLEEANEMLGTLMQFNDSVPERTRFYQVLKAVLDITLRDDLELQDYVPNLTRMFDEEILGHAVASVSGETRFYGLTPTDMRLTGIDKHLRLLESYEKLQVARLASVTAR